MRVCGAPQDLDLVKGDLSINPIMSVLRDLKSKSSRDYYLKGFVREMNLLSKRTKNMKIL